MKCTKRKKLNLEREMGRTSTIVLFSTRIYDKNFYLHFACVQVPMLKWEREEREWVDVFMTIMIEWKGWVASAWQMALHRLKLQLIWPLLVSFVCSLIFCSYCYYLCCKSSRFNVMIVKKEGKTQNVRVFTLFV